MKAAYYERIGPARDVLQVGELPDPVPRAGEVDYSEVVELDLHINDPAFAAAAAERLLRMMGREQVP